MHNKVIVGLLALVVGLSGLSCVVPPPPEGGGNDGGGQTDGNGGGTVPLDNLVGVLSVASARTAGGAGEFNVLSGLALFFTPDTDTADDSNVTTKTIGDCVVTTTEVVLGGSTDNTSNADPLDAGLSGVLSTSTATASLDRQIEGQYASGDLAGAGFATGETYTFSFEGGTDIAGFMTSIDLPDSFTSTTPDLLDGTLNIDTTAALDVAWTPSGTANTATVIVTTANISKFVTIVCTFSDTGSATVPQAAMECLLDQPTSTTVTITRSNSTQIEVDLVGGGKGMVGVSAQVTETGAIVAPLDTGGTDPCMFIQCEEGTTCNPATFLCE